MSAAFPSALPRAILIIAALALALALLWWWRTYGEVIRYGYLTPREAARCLIGESDICSLAKALCLGSHPRDFYAYASPAFWASAAAMSISGLWSASMPASGAVTTDGVKG